jgi:long-subunit fatty acid transport protein
MIQKLILTIGFIIHIQIINSQTINDAVIYNLSELSGTARFTSMAGAFGSIGGDLTSISFNPASSSVFLVSELGISSLTNTNSSKTNYFNSENIQENTSFNINQIGGVFVFNNNNNSDWSRISFAYNVHNNYRLDKNYFVKGNNNKGLDNFFLYYADGFRLSDLELYDGESISQAYKILGNEIGYGAQQAFLGYQSYIINPSDFSSDNDSYISNASYSSLSHYYDFQSDGYNKKHTLNFSGFYKNFIHLGININIHEIEYSNTNRLTEDNFNENSSVRKIVFDNTLSTIGEGISFQFGLIARINSKIRFGFSYDSPQWLRLDEVYEQSIKVNFFENDLLISENINPDIKTIFDPYNLKVPSKINTSISYVFGNGFIAIDYCYKDYSKTNFSQKSSSLYLNELNNEVRRSFKNAKNMKIGGEYLIGRFAFRLGRFYEQSFQAENNISTRGNRGNTCGLGINFPRSSINFSLVKQEFNSNYALFSVGLNDKYLLSETKSQFIITYNLKF